MQKRKFQLKSQNFHLKNPLIENIFHSHRLLNYVQKFYLREEYLSSSHSKFRSKFSKNRIEIQT